MSGRRRQGPPCAQIVAVPGVRFAAALAGVRKRRTAGLVYLWDGCCPAQDNASVTLRLVPRSRLPQLGQALMIQAPHVAQKPRSVPGYSSRSVACCDVGGKRWQHGNRPHGRRGPRSFQRSHLGVVESVMPKHGGRQGSRHTTPAGELVPRAQSSAASTPAERKIRRTCSRLYPVTRTTST
jgi:hypothetical protein